MNDQDLDILNERVITCPCFANHPTPTVDYQDPLDGDSLEIFSGKTVIELIPEIDGNRLDSFPAFALLEPEACRYYLGSYLIYFLNQIRTARRIYPVRPFPIILGSPYFSMISYLGRKDTVAWLCSKPDVGNLVIDIIRTMMDTPGFEFENEEIKEMLELIDRLS